MNKLRAVATLAGGSLVALSVWAALRYGGETGVVPFAATAALGGLIAAIPELLARAKRRARVGYRRLREAVTGERDESLYVSAAPLDEPFAALDAAADRLRGDDAHDSVREAEFSEGKGLAVDHSGAHSSAVRVTESGRLAVVGASDRARALARRLEELTPASFERTLANPFRGSEPVKGAPRVFLGLALVALFAAGVGGVANAAYPSGAYNSPEKTVLVSFDARADLDPATTETDVRIEKADFLVGALDEEAVEIRWEDNVTDRVRAHGRQAVATGSHVRDLLTAVRRGDPTAAQAAAVDRIEADLRKAERNVSAALAAKAEHEAVRGRELIGLRERLRASDDGPAGD